MLIQPAQREYRTWVIDSRHWDAYTPGAADIIICTAPKCGTTWMQQIVGSLVREDPTPQSISGTSPWIDARFQGTQESKWAILAAQTHRHVLKSHLPVDGMPIHDDVQYIHVARDGRDAIMSMHNHFTGFSNEQLELFDRNGMEDPAIARPYPRLPKDPVEFYRLWMSTAVMPWETEGFPHPSFFNLEAGYWAQRKRANFLLVHYNDLSADLDGEMRRVAAFLNIAVNEALWPDLVRAAKFDAMQAAGDTLMPRARNTFVGGARRFFNKGTNGRWHDVLNADDLALYDARVREKLSPALAAWLESGRRVAGDPRAAS